MDYVEISIRLNVCFLLWTYRDPFNDSGVRKYFIFTSPLVVEINWNCFTRSFYPSPCSSLLSAGKRGASCITSEAVRTPAWGYEAPVSLPPGKRVETQFQPWSYLCHSCSCLLAKMYEYKWSAEVHSKCSISKKCRTLHVSNVPFILRCYKH